MLPKYGLLQTMGNAFSRWLDYRLRSRRFGKWLRRGIIDLREIKICYPQAIIKEAVRAGADEIIIAKRILTGMRKLEQHPAFWAPGWDSSLDGVRNDILRTELEEADFEHFRRYVNFHRFDLYHISHGVPSLIRGYWEGTMEVELAILDANLTSAFSLAIESDVSEQETIRGNICKVGPIAYRPGIGYSVRIHYQEEIK